MFFPCIGMCFEIDSPSMEQGFLKDLTTNLSWLNPLMQSSDGNSDVCDITFMMRLG